MWRFCCSQKKVISNLKALFESTNLVTENVFPLFGSDIENGVTYLCLQASISIAFWISTQYKLGAVSAVLGVNLDNTQNKDNEREVCDTFHL